MTVAVLLLLATMLTVVVVASIVLVVVAAPYAEGRFDRVPGVRGAAELLHR